MFYDSNLFLACLSIFLEIKACQVSIRDLSFSTSSINGISRILKSKLVENRKNQ